MKITTYRPEDLDEVVNLWQQCELTVPWNNPEKDIDRKLVTGQEWFLVGRLEDQIVATAMGGYEGHRGWVNYLAIAPEHQGKGLGKLIMQELETRLTKAGCPKLNLQIRSSNQQVINFYKKLGYQVDDAISMGKRLIHD